MVSSKFFLLADDDSDDAELFREALSSVNSSVDFQHVDDGHGVFEFLCNTVNRRPDIIFLDLNMPAMGGWQCLSKLKNDIYFKDIPVIMYSTSSHPRDKEIAIELGALGFLTKPSDYKSLQRMLYNISNNAEELKNLLTDKIFLEVKTSY
jgi:CheY-like chemotaxis protein